ncbi:MAG TPA: hypothetical protein VFF11_14950, partial [Candidatus Binatia bacterium]|nr:hypothetical protein [Candidatus Binatia bacterium]
RIVSIRSASPATHTGFHKERFSCNRNRCELGQLALRCSILKLRLNAEAAKGAEERRENFSLCDSLRYSAFSAFEFAAPQPHVHPTSFTA